MIELAEILTPYLPLIWGGLLAVAVFMYVLLDGFDLGIGMLFPLRKSEKERDVMMNSIAPFWDGNETWLVLGVGGLFVAFPLAYAIIMPALYIPIIMMLLGLVFRGVAFEFRMKAEGKSRNLWCKAFFVGSLIATFFQGVVLGGYIQGIEVEGRNFAGGTFDWLTPFSLMVGLSLVSGYIYLGSCWLIIKTEGDLQGWAFNTAKKSLFAIIFCMMAIIIWMPSLYSDIPFLGSGNSLMPQEQIQERWFTPPYQYIVATIFAVFALLSLLAFMSLRKKREIMPFIYGMGIFVIGFIGLALSIWPSIVPPSVDLYFAAAHPKSQFLLLIGAVILLPVILGYTAFVYWVFRGKVRGGDGYLR